MYWTTAVIGAVLIVVGLATRFAVGLWASQLTGGSWRYAASPRVWRLVLIPGATLSEWTRHLSHHYVHDPSHVLRVERIFRRIGIWLIIVGAIVTYFGILIGSHNPGFHVYKFWVIPAAAVVMILVGIGMVTTPKYRARELLLGWLKRARERATWSLQTDGERYHSVHLLPPTTETRPERFWRNIGVMMILYGSALVVSSIVTSAVAL